MILTDLVTPSDGYLDIAVGDVPHDRSDSNGAGADGADGYGDSFALSGYRDSSALRLDCRHGVPCARFGFGGRRWRVSRRLAGFASGGDSRGAASQTVAMSVLVAGAVAGLLVFGDFFSQRLGGLL